MEKEAAAAKASTGSAAATEGLGQQPASKQPADFSWGRAASAGPPAEVGRTPADSEPAQAAPGSRSRSQSAADSAEEPNRRMVTLRGNLEAKLRARALSLLAKKEGAAPPAEPGAAS